MRTSSFASPARITRLFPYLALLVPLAACKVDDHDVGNDGDAATADAASSGSHTSSSSSGSSADGGSGQHSCGTGDDCASGETCFFPIGSCSAKGECIAWPAPGAGECDSVEELCGCDGKQVETGCIAPSGFATGPTTGDSSEACSAKDAGTAPVACGADGSCPTGESCYYPIGSCSAQGQCRVWPLPGAAECASFEDLCGCDGKQVVTGCPTPDGFATGPTTGAQPGADGTCGAVDGGAAPTPCGADGSCPSGESCYYPIGSCSAQGECMVWPLPGTGECNSEEALCGCDGQQVVTGCPTPGGYATGPTTGQSPGVGGCGAVDGGAAPTPCGADSSCPSGETCFFPIGSCSAQGECMVWPAPGGGACGAVEALCGCAGEQVTTGCDAPSGYATGATTGASGTGLCTLDAGSLDGGPPARIACGSTSCDATREYCHVFPSCLASIDGGTSATSYTCEAFPSPCTATTSCQCIVNAYPDQMYTVLSTTGGCTVQESCD